MKKYIHIFLLLNWLIIGTCLRFYDLAVLPPWTDECATIVFSLGNTFKTVPLDQVIGSDLLLQPLQQMPVTGISNVVERLFDESTHPPLYFILTHLWMKLFSNSGEIASIWAARSLSAFWGVVSIPAMFCFGYLAFRSKLVAHIAAATIAVSPFTVFLAREARHYTLIILLVIVSLSCFVKAIETMQNQQPFPLLIAFVWTITNIFGVATHYFFALTLCTEGLVLFTYIWQVIRKRKQNRLIKTRLYLWRIFCVANASITACLIWLPIIQSFYGSEPTNWVLDSQNDNFLSPIGRLFLWVISIFSLLPSAPLIVPIWIIVVSGIATLLYLIWLTPYLIYGLRVFSQSNSGLATQVLTRYTIAAIALFLVCTYFLGIDLTLAARFIFVFAPAIILLVSALLSVCWQRLKKLLKNGKFAVTIVWLIALTGGIIVTMNLGYLQNQRPDLLADLIHKTSQAPVLIATTHKHHGQTGRMMGLAWEFKHLYAKESQNDWQFFLAHKKENRETYIDAVKTLQKSISQIPRPFDLWLVNFNSSVNLELQKCIADNKYSSRIGEYSYKLYHCESKR